MPKMELVIIFLLTLCHLGIRLMWVCTLPVFFHLCTFFVLHEKVFGFSSAFRYVHTRNNQIVSYWTKVFQKKFLLRSTALF